VGVVLVTWNRAHELPRLLESLDRQTIRGDVEIVIVDNASTDGTLQLLRNWPAPLTIYKNTVNVGPAIGRNQGIQLTEAPYIAFADTDAWLEDADILERCVERLDADPKCCGASTAIYLDSAHRALFCLGCYYTEHGHFDAERTFGDTREPHYVSTCFSVYRRVDLLRAGGFDPLYGYGIEDADLGSTVRRQTGGQYHVDRARSTIHEMSLNGREHHWNDFTRKFRYLEWHRHYLLIKQRGVAHWAASCLRLVVNRGYFWNVYRHPMTLGQKIRARVGYPLKAALLLPLYLFNRHRDHIARFRPVQSQVECVVGLDQGGFTPLGKK